MNAVHPAISIDELPVPPAATTALRHVLNSVGDAGGVFATPAVQAIAAPVAAALLRNLAEFYRDQAEVGYLYDCADELDGGAQ